MVLNGRTYTPSQVNNMFIFPGLGLGATLCGARYISQGIVYATSLALASSLTAAERDAVQIFPRVNRIREISHAMAIADSTIGDWLLQGTISTAKSCEDRALVETVMSHFIAFFPLHHSLQPQPATVSA